MKPLRYLWALPTTGVGLLVALVSLCTGGRAAWVAGVIEVHGGFATFVLTHLTPLKGGAAAMTLGHVVIGRDRSALRLTRNHERVHVRQVERWGPLFFPLYLSLSAYHYLRGGDPYQDNPLEREAFDEAP